MGGVWLADMDSDLHRAFTYIILIAGPILGGIFGWSWGRFRHECSFVCSEGLARYECSGSQGKIVRAEILDFGVVKTLRGMGRREHFMGDYSYTETEYEWLDHSRKPLFTIVGRHREPGVALVDSYVAPKPGKVNPEHHFACSASQVWYEWCVRSVNKALDRGESVCFGVLGKGDEALELTTESLTIRPLLGGAKHIPLTQIGGLTVRRKKSLLGTITPFVRILYQTHDGEFPRDHVIDLDVPDIDNGPALVQILVARFGVEDLDGDVGPLL